MDRTIQAGNVIHIRAKKSNGTVYRTWRATVESIDADRLVTVNRVGDRVGGPGGGWTMSHATRAVYWFARPYNLVELYQPSGALKQIYIHIASPAALQRGTLSYTDCELDVVKPLGKAARVVDEDEFDAASAEYGYSAEFCSACRGAASEALAIAANWEPGGAPVFPRRPRIRRWRRHSPRAHQELRTDTPATDSRIRITEV